MSDPSPKPLLPPTITDICLLSSNVPRAVAFYRDGLGLPIKRLDEGFAEFGTEQVVVAVWDRENLAAHVGWGAARHGGSAAMIAVRVDSADEVDAIHETLTERGIACLKPPKLYPWNAYALYVVDPDDHLWEFYFWAGKAREEPDF